MFSSSELGLILAALSHAVRITRAFFFLLSTQIKVQLEQCGPDHGTAERDGSFRA